jgi:hypothetical protein
MHPDARIPPPGNVCDPRALEPPDEERAAVELDFDGHLPCKTTFAREILPGG